MARRAEAERERRAGTEAEERTERQDEGGHSKIKLALGAAGLLLFILGVRRTFHSDDGALGSTPDETEAEPREGKRQRAAAG